DRMGRQFVDALKRAKERGVVIKVLIDAVGSRYSRPPSIRLLRKHKIRSALFMTNPFGIRMPYANLRSHRKVLIVDGNKGFTGGMNIREGFCSEFTTTNQTKIRTLKYKAPSWRKSCLPLLTIGNSPPKKSWITTYGLMLTWAMPPNLMYQLVVFVRVLIAFWPVRTICFWVPSLLPSATYAYNHPISSLI